MLISSGAPTAAARAMSASGASAAALPFTDTTGRRAVTSIAAAVSIASRAKSRVRSPSR